MEKKPEAVATAMEFQEKEAMWARILAKMEELSSALDRVLGSPSAPSTRINAAASSPLAATTEGTNIESDATPMPPAPTRCSALCLNHVVIEPMVPFTLMASATAATTMPLDMATVVPTASLQEEVGQLGALQVFDRTPERIRSGAKHPRFVKWVSRVPINRRPVRWPPRRKYRHSSPPPPPCPPEQQCVGQETAPKPLPWPSFPCDGDGKRLTYSMVMSSLLQSSQPSMVVSALPRPPEPVLNYAPCSFNADNIGKTAECLVFELLPSWQCSGFSPWSTLAKHGYLLHCSWTDQLSVPWDPGLLTSNWNVISMHSLGTLKLLTCFCSVLDDMPAWRRGGFSPGTHVCNYLIRALVVSEVTQRKSYLPLMFWLYTCGNSMSNAPHNSSAMWCLDVVLRRLKKWWTHTRCVQTASAVFEAHSQFLDTSEPTQLDYLLLRATPLASSEVYKTMLSCDQFSARGVKGISHEIQATKLVLNCYCFVFTYAGDQLPKILERYLHSHGKIVVIFSCPCTEQSYRLEESIEVLTSPNMIMGNDMEHHRVGQKPHGIIVIHTNDSALWVFTNPLLACKNNRLTVCCTCEAMNKIQEGLCKPTDEEQSNCVLHILFPLSYLGAISKPRASLNISSSIFLVTKEMEPEGSIMKLLRVSEKLITYPLKGCNNSPLQMIDTSLLWKIWLVQEQWDPEIVFSSRLLLGAHFVSSSHDWSCSGYKLFSNMKLPGYMSTTLQRLSTHRKCQYFFQSRFIQRDEVSLCTLLISVTPFVGSMKKTCDLARHGQWIKYLEMIGDNTDRRSVPSVSAQLKCDGTKHHLDHILNPQIWALQVTHHMAKVNWQNLLLQRHVGGLSPWDPGGVLFVNILGVIVKLQVPWDPGVHLVIGGVGLRSSRFSRGGECHDPGHRDATGPSHDMGWADTGLGLAGVVDELYKGSDVEENNRKGNESKAVAFFLPQVRLVPHLMLC